jgi:hypothetical protein
MNLSMELVGGVVIDPVKESGYMAVRFYMLRRIND